MISEKFQEMIREMSTATDRTIGILDKKLIIIASNDKQILGKKSEIESFSLVSSNDFIRQNGFTYRYFGDKKTDEFILIISGEDDLALSYANLLAVSLAQIVVYYNNKHSKSVFIKNLIFDNMLPGEISFRTRELKIADDVNRVCFVIKSESFMRNLNLIDILRNIFPDATKDYILDIGDNSVTLIKEIDKTIDESKLEKLAVSVVSSISSEYYIKIVIGVGSIVQDIESVRDSFRHAQLALEVRRLFSNEKSVSMYSQLGIARLIYQIPVALCELFLKEVFKKCTIDSIDGDLMFTINKFFENNLNISETSRKLFVHRNTLVYRIEKIKRVTGLDLRNFEDAIVFKIALMVSKYMKEFNVHRTGR